MTKERTVIYKVNGVYHTTNETNYNSFVQDARKVHKLADFKSVTEIIQYYMRYFGCTPNDFVVKGEV